MKTAQNPGFGVHIEFVEVYVLLFWRSFLQKFFFIMYHTHLKWTAFLLKKVRTYLRTRLAQFPGKHRLHMKLIIGQLGKTQVWFTRGLIVQDTSIRFNTLSLFRRRACARNISHTPNIDLVPRSRFVIETPKRDLGTIEITNITRTLAG